MFGVLCEINNITPAGGPNSMAEILTDIYSLYSFAQFHDTRLKGYSIDGFSECYPIFENLILCDKVVVEQNGVRHYCLEAVCNDLLDAIGYITDSRLYGETSIYKNTYVDNISYRGLIYADVAKESNLYFSPHPDREGFISNRIVKYIKTTAAIIIEHFDQQFNQSASGQFASFNIKIPPVVEHILYFSKAQDKTILESVNEIRNSKNAIAFRQYIQKLDDELKDLTPRKRIEIYQPLFRDIDRLCNSWSLDMKNEVQYRKRRISLSTIPIMGKLLDVIGAGQIEIKDLILFSDTPHLLFINDLYRK
jgi:hypothetical protein